MFWFELPFSLPSGARHGEASSTAPTLQLRTTGFPHVNLHPTVGHAISGDPGLFDEGMPPAGVEAEKLGSAVPLEPAARSTSESSRLTTEADWTVAAEAASILLHDQMSLSSPVESLSSMTPLGNLAGPSSHRRFSEWSEATTKIDSRSSVSAPAPAGPSDTRISSSEAALCTLVVDDDK